MTYTPHTWSSTPRYASSALGLNRIEQGVAGAHTSADLALARLGRGVFNVLDEGAVAGDTGTNATVNAAALAAANAKALASGGLVYFPRGTYQTNQTLTIYPNVSYVGDAGTKIKLANGANVDLVATQDFTTLYAGSTQAGPTQFVLRDLVLDGNGANQSSGWVLSTYGSRFRVENLKILNGKSGGWRSKWAAGGTDMEAKVSHCRILNNYADQLDWQGPHDSVFTDVHVFTDSTRHGNAQMPGTYAMRIWGNAGGEQLLACHTWGFTEYGLRAEKATFATNCQFEGARVNVWIDCDQSEFSGHVFGTANGTPGPWSVAGGGTGEVGVQLGASGATQWGNKIDISCESWNAGDEPIRYAGDNGNEVTVRLKANNLTAFSGFNGHYNPASGVPSFNSRIRVLCSDRPSLGYDSGQERLLAALGYMDAAIETTPRAIDGSYTAVSGRVNLSYLTAYRNQTITKLGALSRNTALVGLTDARWGLYTVAANGDLTLVARTAQNTTTAYTATFTEYAPALDTTGGFPASYTLEAGKRYAFAQIVRFATTAPVLRGHATNLPAATTARSPRVCGLVAGQTDLPTSITAASVTNDGNAVYLFGLA